MSEQVASVSSLPAPRADVSELWFAGRRPRPDRVWVAARFGVDVLALTIAAALSGAAGPEALGLGWTIAMVAGCLVVLTCSGLYLPDLRINIVDEVRKVLAGTALACIAVAGLALLDPGRTGAGDAAVVSWLVAGTLLSTSRIGLHATQRYARRRGRGGIRTLIVGAGNVGSLTAKRLLDDPNLGLRPIGFLDKEPLVNADGRTIAGLPVLGASWDLERVVAQNEVDQVVIAFSTAPHRVMVDLVRRCWTLGVNVLVVPRLFEVEGTRAQVQHLGALPLVSLRTTDPKGAQFAVKYAVDRLVAATALIAVSPLLLLIALAVLATMGRPVLFRQQRMGRDGRLFEILKFRTMRGVPERDGDANGHWAETILASAGINPGEALAPAADPSARRTKLGAILRKTSLDELPQLWNVVRGDMSLIGPRPEVAHHAALFQDIIARYPERHRVKSGLTGWAQVNGLRGNTSLQDRIEWDNFYIENWSLWLDLKIVLRTLPSLLGRGGAH
jgi:exopolysaccharide biosynthesis polyprenyl glycosylphosphotransferase